MALLPGGDARIRTQQARIESRLHELVSLSQIKQELDGVHLDDAARIKKEEEEEQDRGDKMDDEGATTTTSSPTAKNRLASRVEVRSAHLLPFQVPLTDSVCPPLSSDVLVPKLSHRNAVPRRITRPATTSCRSGSKSC